MRGHPFLEYFFFFFQSWQEYVLYYQGSRRSSSYSIMSFGAAPRLVCSVIAIQLQWLQILLKLCLQFVLHVVISLHCMHKRIDCKEIPITFIESTLTRCWCELGKAWMWTRQWGGTPQSLPLSLNVNNCLCPTLLPPVLRVWVCSQLFKETLPWAWTEEKRRLYVVFVVVWEYSEDRCPGQDFPQLYLARVVVLRN